MYRCSMSYDASYLICILHACPFYKSHLVNRFSTTFFQNDRVHVQQVQTVRVVKYAYFLGTQNKRAMHEK
jgi:hypothetical protein